MLSTADLGIVLLQALGYVVVCCVYACGSRRSRAVVGPCLEAVGLQIGIICSG